MSFREIVDTVLKASPADQTEIMVQEHDDNLTRFANNSIHQNVNERNTQITIRTVIGRRVGIAISNDLRPENLESLVKRAHQLTKLQPENPEFNGLPLPQPIPPVACFDADTTHCPPNRRAESVRAICGTAEEAGYTAAGSLRTASLRLGVANSLGVFAEHETSLVDVSTVIMAADSSGWAQASGCRLDQIDAKALGAEAVAKARLGANPVDCPPGEYTVILDPYATADLLTMLASDGMSAMSFQEERSWLNGRLGKKIMSDLVTIVDDGHDLSGIPAPFDFEGMPKKMVNVVKSGVAMGPVYDRFTAGREPGRESTGHATPPSAAERLGPLPLNLFLRPGTSSVEEMIRSTRLGLYITRFWYTRPVHPRDAVITGMTRDGTYLVRDGQIVQPVKSLRFTQSYIEALNNTEAIGATPIVLWSEGMALSVPAIKMNQFRFTSGTR